MTESEEKELRKLRHVHTVHGAIRELEAEANFVAKRYRQGQKLLERHIVSVESEIDENVMQGAGAMDDMSPELTKLIADPRLENTPIDNKV